MPLNAAKADPVRAARARKRIPYSVLRIVLLGTAWPCAAPAAGAGVSAQAIAGVDPAGHEEIVSYSSEFFTRYRPATALEMLQRIPGFQLDDGDDERGFGGAAGNILLNDRYPSAKQDKPSALLERIPAGQVERIDLIRAPVRGIDLRGHPVVASVILREDVPAMTRYSGSVRKNFEHSPLTVQLSTSLSDRWGDVEYNAGIGGRRFASGEFGPADRLDADGVLFQEREDESFLRGHEGNANLNALTWLGQTLFQLNSQFAFENRHEVFSSVVTSAPGEGGEGDEFFTEDGRTRSFELGADFERALDADLLARAIFLYGQDRDETEGSQERHDASGARELLRIADRTEKETEAIVRLELDWAAWPGHTLQLDVEGARNVIDSALVQTDDTGSGPMIVPVPGANTRVQEDRGDILVSDVWQLGELELDFGVGAEASRISQTGDAVQTRNFFFLKPHATLTYSPSRESQTRLRVAREVAQLDFEDFVSATVLRDDDVLLGNPDLRPQSSWVAEVSHERRFGELGALKVTAFHYWISDVQDLLPLAPTFEAPGNIGDGRRYGLELEATAPLDALGLTGGRLDLEARIQESKVTDPVTGLERELSGEPAVGKPLEFLDDQRHSFAVNFRQDFESAGVAWGWDVRRRSDRKQFKVNELDRHSDGTEFNVFVETTRWFGQKITLAANNLLDFRQERERTLYTGERGLSPIDIIERQSLQDGRRLVLTISGSF
jgi:hypothetical protein